METCAEISRVIFLKSPMLRRLCLLFAPQCLSDTQSTVCCLTESHLPALLMLIMCTASHVEICNHSVIELMKGKPNTEESHPA